MTPTGSWPSTRPGRTAYSPFTMCTSVPQMVVVVMRTTASPARGIGFGRSTTTEPPRLEERHRSHRVHRILLRRASVQDDADDVPLLPACGRMAWIPEARLR